MKTHYAEVERGNESNGQDEWGITICNRELEPHHLTNRDNEVTCKHCLSVINKQDATSSKPTDKPNEQY